MSYINNQSIKIANGPNLDSFGRFRVSQLENIFHAKQLYGDNSTIWTTLVTGNATSSFIPNNSCMQLSASATSSIVRQTKRRHIYQPGNGQQVIMTANFNQPATSGVIKRIGYFDQSNGIGFEQSGSSFGVFLRTNISGTPTDIFISQSNWNLDLLDGTGPSTMILNPTASQIYVMDFEWLGVGRIRYGTFQAGQPVYCHQITNVNSLNTVYMSTPNQPVRFEIINSGSAATQVLTHICTSVNSEAGIFDGHVQCISNSNLGGLSLSAGATYGLLALRLKSGSLDGVVIPKALSSVQTTGTVVYEISLQMNPSGSLPWSWQDMPNSVVQYATASANTYTIATTGQKIFSNVSAGSNGLYSIPYDIDFTLGSDVTGSQDVLVLGWMGINGNAANSAVSFVWAEQ